MGQIFVAFSEYLNFTHISCRQLKMKNEGHSYLTGFDVKMMVKSNAIIYLFQIMEAVFGSTSQSAQPIRPSLLGIGQDNGINFHRHFYVKTMPPFFMPNILSTAVFLLLMQKDVFLKFQVLSFGRIF